MKDNEQIKEAVRQRITDLRAPDVAGDHDAHIERCMAKALLAVLDAGYELSDMEWFEGTVYYTGHRHVRKAA